MRTAFKLFIKQWRVNSVSQLSYNNSISRVRLQSNSSTQVHVTVTVHPLPTPYTLCPSVSRVTASERPLNDSVGCPSSLLKLLTVLGFIIDETLESRILRYARFANFCQNEHSSMAVPVPSSATVMELEGILYVRVRATVSSTPMTPHYSFGYHLGSTSGPTRRHHKPQRGRYTSLLALTSHTDSGSD